MISSCLRRTLGSCVHLHHDCLWGEKSLCNKKEIQVISTEKCNQCRLLWMWNLKWVTPNIYRRHHCCAIFWTKWSWQNSHHVYFPLNNGVEIVFIFCENLRVPATSIFNMKIPSILLLLNSLESSNRTIPKILSYNKELKFNQEMSSTVGLLPKPVLEALQVLNVCLFGSPVQVL